MQIHANPGCNFCEVIQQLSLQFCAETHPAVYASPSPSLIALALAVLIKLTGKYVERIGT